MRVLFLTNNANTAGLYEWLKERETDVQLFGEKLLLPEVKRRCPDMIVSYNYRYVINRDVIAYMKGRMINLHISLLPWNRGANPNLWSFLDNTPKGVSIHLIEEGLDMGAVLAQREVFMDEKQETFMTSYERLNAEIRLLFREVWDEIKEGRKLAIAQSGEGSCHTIRDFQELQRQLPFSWDDNVAEVVKKYQELIKQAAAET